MKYALVIGIEKDSSEDKKKWSEFSCNCIETTDKPVGLTRLNKGTFLFDLKDGLKSFSDLVLAARKWRVDIQVLFFDEKPSWIIS